MYGRRLKELCSSMDGWWAVFLIYVVKLRKSKYSGNIRTPIVIISLAVWLLACGEPNKASLAVIDGSPVTSTEVEAALGRPLRELEKQIYEIKRQKIEELIDQRLLSREAVLQGVSVDELLEREVNAKMLPVSDHEIAILYNANKARIPVDLETVRDQIRDVLHEQKLATQKAFFIQSLRAKAKIVSYLKPPPIFRADISIEGAPFKGSEDAAVTMVKFEDFQCPFCKQAQPVLRDILIRYRGKVRLVHKDLPLDSIHPQAREAAEAARCAGDEGMFWEYHDRLYASSSKIEIAELKSYAKEIGLAQVSFEKCLSTGKHKAVVQRDVNDGAALGLTGTPAFFINGREVTGAQPIEVFAAIIDEELARGR